MWWVIFWAIVAIHVVVGIKRLPVYFKRVYTHEREYWTHQTDAQCQTTAAWMSLFLASFWPWYEGGIWVRNHIVSAMTAEERKQEEYEKASQIVAEYTKNKEREEREAFERALKEDK